MEGNGVTFRPATTADLPAVRSLLERCGLPTRDLQREHLEHFFVCHAGDRLAGVVGIDTVGELGLLRSLAVDSQLRGRRIAHGLWMRSHDDALRRGVRRLYLLTTTAEQLFTRWGFCRVARELVPHSVQATEEFASLCPSSAVAMALDLVAT